MTYKRNQNDRIVNFRKSHNGEKNEIERRWHGHIGRKSYLSQQIRLLTLSTNDLFTDEEYELYMKIVSCINEINREDSEGPERDPTIKLDKIAEKKEYQKELNALIAKHSGTPRTVSVKRMLDTRRLPHDENGEVIWPECITWDTLKLSRKIAEFCSTESRAMGLKDKDVTFDKIIVKWKSPDILKQIVLDGFILPVGTENGIEYKKIIFVTASAGQLRRDKAQFMEENTWNRIKSKLMCGLDFDTINKIEPANCNKVLAYIALASSATEPCPEIDIDKCIVVNDMSTFVNGLVDDIDDHYQMTRCFKDIEIKHTDGVGMMLPKVSRKNFMIRAPFVKGLLCSFNFIQFCKVNNVPAKCVDIYGTEHDLIAEDIQVILFKSQFKLHTYYENWDSYKRLFHENECEVCKTNEEEDYIRDETLNYQFIQSLVSMTDEEIAELTNDTHERIKNIASDKESMLRAMGADIYSDKATCRALAIYPENLREVYFRSSLKDIKTRMLYDARSGKIRCDNKRLFVVPDLYAVCEFLFMHNDNPKGLLENGEVACISYRSRDTVDCLRSPHLYMEHALRTVVKDPSIYQWFYTDAIYTSCHDLISKVLQFDCDGDQLNVVAEPVIIRAAQREIAEHDIVPLNYELGKAPGHIIDREEMFNSLWRAHEYSGIGAVSNSLTKLWNKEDPDYYAAGCLVYYNNLVNKIAL